MSKFSVYNKPFYTKKVYFISFRFMYKRGIYSCMRVAHSLQYVYNLYCLLLKLICGLQAYVSKLMCGVNPLAHNFQLTHLKMVCILIANIRKLALYICLCINSHSIETKWPKNYNYIITHH